MNQVKKQHSFDARHSRDNSEKLLSEEYDDQFFQVQNLDLEK